MTFLTELERLHFDGYPMFTSTEFLRNHASAIAELARAAKEYREANEQYAKATLLVRSAMENRSIPQPVIKAHAIALARISAAGAELIKALAALDKEPE